MAADEMNVTRETIQLRNHDGCLALPASLDQRGGELRATVEGISTLPRLDLGELGSDLEALGLGEPGDGRALGVNTQARLALLARAYPVICDERLGHRWRSLVLCERLYDAITPFTREGSQVRSLHRPPGSPRAEGHGVPTSDAKRRHP
jgi:hypothetical protein